ncbi:MAG: hypothetical protein GF355_01180 [Candidatus Eisenbacteria bacterium]|nr:hypothetical protein [Candidatus Eisenbacteria bacterium]
MSPARTPHGRVFLNGRILPRGQARIACDDAGFLLGVGAFETLKVEDGIPLFLRDHLQRLRSGLRRIGINAFPWDTGDAVAQVIRANRLGTAALRITVSDGAPADEPTLLVASRDVMPRPPMVRLAVYPRRKSAHDPLAGLKTTSRLPYELARRWAAAQDCFDALLANEEGDLAEGSLCNLFCVRSGRIVTPPLSRGLLPGVTRARILAICRRVRLPVVESPVRLDDLRRAEEVFLSNSTQGVLGVDRVRGLRRTYPGAEGLLAQRIAAAYAEHVARHKQAIADSQPNRA